MLLQFSESALYILGTLLRHEMKFFGNKYETFLVVDLIKIKRRIKSILSNIRNNLISKFIFQIQFYSS